MPKSWTPARFAARPDRLSNASIVPIHEAFIRAYAIKFRQLHFSSQPPFSHPMLILTVIYATACFISTEREGMAEQESKDGEKEAGKEAGVDGAELLCRQFVALEVFMRLKARFAEPIPFEELQLSVQLQTKRFQFPRRRRRPFPPPCLLLPMPMPLPVPSSLAFVYLRADGLGWRRLGRFCS